MDFDTLWYSHAVDYSVIKQFKEALCTNRKNAQDALDQGWPTFS